MSLAWCAGCNNVSIFQRPRWRRWLDRWAPLNGFKPVRALSLEEFASEQVAQGHGLKMHRKLMDELSLSFAQRARAEGAADAETGAWRIAKRVLGPTHLILYIAATRQYVSRTRALVWIDELDSHAAFTDPQLKQMLRQMRDDLLGA
ncbi:hypothetical protein JM946_08205 [Steroidobacter sp. S1-65]|uniref:Uncharacterized protein n=1 Tax=Steroidobacter gossypii TaxID=2805490 RepID=A0ABS1WUS6_9GAMM|nr:hypothetical protein [Steroidobacter gossypii]MBM0104726.1 hypothetical protein [Steroidobacter gossypii]